MISVDKDLEREEDKIKEFDELPPDRIIKSRGCNNQCLSGYGPEYKPKDNEAKCIYCGNKK